MVLDILAASYLLINLNTENSKICDILFILIAFECEVFHVILFGKFEYEEECKSDSLYL